MMTLILHFVALNAGVLTAVLLVELVLYRLARSFEPRWHPARAGSLGQPRRRPKTLVTGADLLEIARAQARDAERVVTRS